MAAAIEACAVSKWQVESHTFFGTSGDVMNKVKNLNVGVGRRLFYAVVEGDGVSKVYEYEHKKDSTYSVKVADAPSAHNFNVAVDRSTYANRGNSCVGAAVKALPEYTALHFHALTEQDLQQDHKFAEILPVGQAAAAASSNLKESYIKAEFHMLC